VLSYMYMRRAAVIVSLAALALVEQGTPAVAGSAAAPLTDEGGIPWFLLLTPEVIKALLIAVGVVFVVALVAAALALRRRAAGRAR